MLKSDDTGSDVSRRFDYQLACAFLTLILLSETTDKLTVILERGDDFVIIKDFNETAEAISFFQVKTRSDGPFTLNMVIRGEWIKKQAKNYLNFVNDSAKNILLTNFGIKIDGKLIDDTSLIKISSLDDGEEKKKLIDEIKAIIGTNGTVDDFYLSKSTLSLEAYKSQLMGELVTYVNKYVTGGLNSEAIETIYKTVWGLLHDRQSYVLNDEEKADYQKIIEKKGFELSQLQAILGIMKEIDIPEKKEISSFFSCNEFNIGASQSLLSFLDEYQSFRSKSHLARTMLEQCRKIIEVKKNSLQQSATALEYSISVLQLLESSPMLMESPFFQQYKISIAAMFTYKAFME